ncbi:MAG: M28 family peptidase [Xanthomonadales bacterium]|nr:M28 family peptidase [Xanthomonadales bacterium]
MNRITLLLAFGLLSAPILAAAMPSVLVVDIDRAGAETVARLKSDTRVGDWSELGERLLIEADGKAADALQRELVAKQRLIKRIDNHRLRQLAAVPRIHHLPDGDDEHREGPDLTGSSSRWYVEATGHSKGARTLGNQQVLSYQTANRTIAKSVPAADMATLAAKVDADRWFRTVSRLASYNRMNRDGFQAALGVVGQAFQELGLAVSTPQFDVVGASAFVQSMTPGRNFNVIGFKPGQDDSVVVIGGHLDSRNTPPNASQPSPGAEDNGSGCSGVVEAARVLAPLPSEHGIVFICFGMEEWGLWGSYGHAQFALDSGLDIVGMINMDMIAFDGDDRLDLLMDTAPVGESLTDMLADIAETYTDLEVEISQGLGRSDHAPYLEIGVPAALLIENDFEIYGSYHQTTDTPDKLSPVMAGEIIKVAVLGAATLAKARVAGNAWDGYWYDPGQSGQGLHIQALDNGDIVVAWYTYDNDGNLYWLVGSGALVDDVASFQLTRTSGGTFPPSEQPDGVTHTPWGTLSIRFDNCDHALAEWSPVEGSVFNAGSMPLLRLARPQGTACP